MSYNPNITLASIQQKLRSARVIASNQINFGTPRATIIADLGRAMDQAEQELEQLNQKLLTLIGGK